MKICIIKGCEGRRRDQSIKMFGFPNKKTDRDRLNLWLNNIGMNASEFNKLKSNVGVCSRHFEPIMMGSINLLRCAAPTLHLGHNNNNIQKPEIPKILNVRKCSVPGCDNRCPPTRVYRIPTVEKGRDLWLAAIGREDTGMAMYVCKYHFPCDRKVLPANILPSLKLNSVSVIGDEMEMNEREYEEFIDEQTTTTYSVQEDTNLECSSQSDVFDVVGSNTSDLLDAVPSNTADDGIDGDDINEINEVPLDIEEEIDQYACKSCQKLAMRAEHYSNLCKDLEGKDARNKQIVKLKEKIEELTNKLFLVEKNAAEIYMKQIKMAPTASKEAIEFSRVICGDFKQYSTEQRELLLRMHIQSPKAYRFMRDTLRFRLPSHSTVKEWNNDREISTGFNHSALSNVKDFVATLPEHERVCAIVFDDITLREETDDTIQSKAVHVQEDMEDYAMERGDGVEKCQFFMLKGLLREFEGPVSFHFSNGGLNPNALLSLLMDNIRAVTNIGLRVIAIIGGRRSSHTILYKLINRGSSTSGHFLHNGKKIYLLYDYCNLFRLLRNGLLNNPLNTPLGVASWEVLKEFFAIDSLSEMNRVAPKLRKSHIYPFSNGKMKLNIAMETLSATVADGIDNFFKKGLFKQTEAYAHSTASFIRAVNTAFQMLNVRQGNELDDSEERQPIRRKNLVVERLRAMRDFFLEFAEIEPQLNCLSEIAFTINGVINAAQDMLLDKNVNSVFQGDFNQDCMQSIFVKGYHGNLVPPTSTQIKFAASQMTLRTMSLKNCDQNNESDAGDSLCVGSSEMLLNESEEWIDPEFDL